MSQWAKRSKTYWKRKHLTKNVILHDCGIQIYHPLRRHPTFRKPSAGCITPHQWLNGIEHQRENKTMAPAPSISLIWTHSSSSKCTTLSKTHLSTPSLKRHSSLSAELNLYPFSALRGKPGTLMNLIISFSADVGMPWAGRQSKSCISNIPTNTQNPSTLPATPSSLQDTHQHSNWLSSTMELRHMFFRTWNKSHCIPKSKQNKRILKL